MLMGKGITWYAAWVNILQCEKNGCHHRYSHRFHWSPVVVLLFDGPRMGTRPQCGPSMVGWIWISWWWLRGRSWMRQSSDRRTIRVLEKRHRTLMLPTSWSNLPPSAPATRMQVWWKHALVEWKTYKPRESRERIIQTKLPTRLLIVQTRKIGYQNQPNKQNIPDCVTDSTNRKIWVLEANK